VIYFIFLVHENSGIMFAGCHCQMVIKSPIDHAECCNETRSFIGRSGNGVCYASIYACRLRVWILSECPDQMEWTLKHDRVLEPDDWWEVVMKGDYQQIKCSGPWILDDYYDYRKGKMNVDWSSDDDDIICGAEGKENGDMESMYPPPFHLLGFHPFKEVIFLTALGVAVAYHWNTSRVQFMGILKPNNHKSTTTACTIHLCIRCAYALLEIYRRLVPAVKCFTGQVKIVVVSVGSLVSVTQLLCFI
jgi:hypothetical protein